MQVILKESVVSNGRCLLLKSKESNFQKHYVAYSGKRYKFFSTKNDNNYLYYALIPINYYTRQKNTKIVVVVQKGNIKEYKSFKIKVVAGRYKSESLKVEPSKASLSNSNKIRVAREAKRAKKIYSTTTPYSHWQSRFLYPMNSKITSMFGNKRVFNGRLKSYHSGTDFRAKVGEPIKAVNSAKVVLVQNRFFAGNSIILDHGEGIYSCYYHLSKPLVKKGQMVYQGDVVGLAGATGRVTGPHLHFSTRVGGIQVDPLQLLDLLNSI
jgi:murein DD-endopeptidase MepM/ murein hydrolase activator NlpD